MICTILAASTLMLAPVERPRMNTVQYFDHLIRVSERVLDRSVCPDIERVQAVDRTGWDHLTDGQKKIREDVATRRKERQREALERHCKSRVASEEKDVRECDLK